MTEPWEEAMERLGGFVSEVYLSPQQRAFDLATIRKHLESLMEANIYQQGRIEELSGALQEWWDQDLADLVPNLRDRTARALHPSEELARVDLVTLLLRSWLAPIEPETE